MQLLESLIRKDLGIPERLTSKVLGFFQKEQLAKNEFLVKRGHRCYKLCLIESGYLRLFMQTDKKVVTHWIYRQDQWVTDITSFYLEVPAKWNIQALTPTTVYSLNHSDYFHLKKEVPNWERYQKTLIIKMMSGLENRVLALLSMSAEERFQYLFKSDSEMFNELPLNFLASMLGMTPETLSRIRKNFTS